MDQLLGIEAFSLDKILQKEPDFLVSTRVAWVGFKG
jgi:hypothetical protein